MTRRRSLLLLSTALLLATPTAAVAATTLGSPGSPGGGCNGSDPVEVIQTARANGAKDAATSPGVITSWTYNPGSGESVVTLRVYRPTPAANQYVVLAEDGPPRTLAASSGAHTFPTRIPLSAGNTIGLRVASGSCLSTTSSSVDKLLIKPGTPTAVGGTATFPIASSATNIYVTAIVEPDVDLDGYGDETQDACPAKPSTQQPCPSPDTVITKKPKRHSLKPKRKLTFTSTIAGSSFSCSIDGKTAKGCTSPATYKCLKPGKHAFSVVATSPAGVVDPTPATTKFRVPADRRGC